MPHSERVGIGVLDQAKGPGQQNSNDESMETSYKKMAVGISIHGVFLSLSALPQIGPTRM
jgi:hypothetical protein